MYELSPEPKYVDFVFVLADHLLTQQNLDSDDDVYGSFHSLPSANTGLYLEGLTDAIHAAELAGDRERAARYRQRALMAYPWLLWLQYDERSSAGLPDPTRAVGGVRSPWPSTSAVPLDTLRGRQVLPRGRRRRCTTGRRWHLASAWTGRLQHAIGSVQVPFGSA